jgi:[ribosomal protein S5]-alanine N-acetyltransferase
LLIDDRRLQFTTERCELRPVSPDDTSELHRVWTSPGVRRFLWDNEIIPIERAAEAVSTSLELFAKHRFGLWAARLKGSPEICGFTGIWPFRDPPEFELLYGVAEPLWGQGYAVEVSQAILAYCYDTLDMSVVCASIDAPNAASARVLEKLGFTRLRRATVGGLDLIFFDRVRLRADASTFALRASADKSAGQDRTRGPNAL